MPELKDRLQTALGAAYRLEKELGGGGMSRVFVAEETDLGRKVVVKVLPPEMGAGVNAERFRREIQLAASLQHPHIVPLLHAGRADDLVWYTMPLIEGESLRAKLAREGELPIPEAVRIVRDVADALAHAHQHGVVHRDIKPDNVLISGHHAVVTDFGVAKALSESTGATSLTSLGVALGTPAYMAPEQAAADPHVDHRADIYALGALAYEMLTGRPPFVGTNPQQVLAAQVTQAPEAVTQHRAAVPPGLAALVMRCLEKKAADRWQTAAEVHAQLEAMATPSGGMTPTAAVPATRVFRFEGRRRLVAAAAALVILAGAAWVLVLGTGGGARALDANVVAVLPFRVAGADPALHYLREGMIDLLAAKLTGEGGPRASDPRTVTSAWRRAAGSDERDVDQDAALAVARAIGAGQALLGGIVGAPSHLVLSGTLLAVPGGTTRAQASVEGPADSLPALVDRLTAQLLVRGSRVGEGEASLTTTSLAALQAYLAGQLAYRGGSYEAAARQFTGALQYDSGFALAAFGLIVVNGWGAPVPDLPRVRRLAWAGRSRLSARDRTVLESYLGPRFPEPAYAADLLAARERAVAAAPDRADAWYFLGDEYFHNGRYLGYRDWVDRAAAAFDRALALDSAFTGPLSHRINIAAWRRDTALVRHLAPLYLKDRPIGRDAFDYVVRWDISRALGDRALLREILAAYDSAPTAPAYLAGYVQWLGDDPVLEDSLLRMVARRAGSQGERAAELAVRLGVLLNRGRLGGAVAAADTLGQLGRSDLPAAFVATVGELYFDGDTGAARAAARRLVPYAEGPAADSADLRPQRTACVLGQWRIAHGEAAAAARQLARLRGALVPGDTVPGSRAARICLALLEAMQATVARRPDATTAVERLDSLLRLGPDIGGPAGPAYENLALGRLFAALGQPARALAALGRRGYFGADLPNYSREEGRLAAQLGDRDAAIAAYQRYLAIVSDPDPVLRPVVEQVKGELARLVGEKD